MNNVWSILSKLKRNFEFQFSEAVLRRRLTLEEQKNHPYNIENSTFYSSTSIFDQDFDDNKIKKISSIVRDIQSEQRLMNAISRPFLERFGAISFPWIYIQELCEKKNLFNFSYIDEETNETSTHLKSEQLSYISRSFRIKTFVKFIFLMLFTVGTIVSEIFLSNMILRILFVLILIYFLFFKDKFGSYLIKMDFVKKIIHSDNLLLVKNIFPNGIDYYIDELDSYSNEFIDRNLPMKVFLNHTGSRDKLSYISNNINEFWSTLQSTVQKEDILEYLSQEITYENLKPVIKENFEKDLIKDMNLSYDSLNDIDQNDWNAIVLYVKSNIEKYYYYFNKTKIIHTYFKNMLSEVNVFEIFYEEIKVNYDIWNESTQKDCNKKVKGYVNDLLSVLSSNLNVFFRDEIFYQNYFIPSALQIDSAIEVQSQFQEKDDGIYHTIVKSRNDNIPLYALRTNKSYLLINFAGSFEEKEAIKTMEKIDKNAIDLPLVIAKQIIS